jgi:glycogen operon protein
VAQVCRLRSEHDVFRRARFFASGELRWLRPDGQPMEAADWSNPGARAVAVGGADGLLLVNAWWEPLSFRLPDDRTWAAELDTADPTVARLASGTIELAGRSLVLAGAGAST